MGCYTHSNSLRQMHMNVQVQCCYINEGRGQSENLEMSGSCINE